MKHRRDKKHKNGYCSYFSGTSKSSVVSSSSDSEDDNESQIDVRPNSPKKHYSSSTSKPPSKSGSGIRRYNKKWEETFPWLEFDRNLQDAICKLCKKGGRSLQRTGGAWITKPFTNWKKAAQKMKSHSKSEVHLLYCQLDVEADRARKEESIISQLQNVGISIDYKIGRRALIRCTHFLAHQHIAHNTNFGKLVELVVSCGGVFRPSFIELEKTQRTPQKWL